MHSQKETNKQKRTFLVFLTRNKKQKEKEMLSANSFYIPRFFLILFCVFFFRFVYYAKRLMMIIMIEINTFHMVTKRENSILRFSLLSKYFEENI